MIRNFAVLMITPVAIESLGYQYYIVFAVLGGCIPLLVFFLYPETMGRSLEQMDELFRESASIAGIVKASLKPPANDIEQLAKQVERKQSENSVQIEVQIEHKA